MKKALTWLGFGPDGKYDKDIEKELFSSSWKIYLVIHSAIFLLELAMFMMLCGKAGGPFFTRNRSFYFIFYTGIILVTLLFIVIDLLWDKSDSKQYKRYLDYGFIYAIFITFCTCGITLINQMEGKGLTVYAYMLLVTAALFMLKPWQSISLFGSSFLLLNVLFPYFPPSNGFQLAIDNFLNSFIISGISITLSIYFCKYRVKSYKNQKIIDKQYVKIRETNERLSHENIVDSLTGLYNRRYLDNTVHTKFHDLIKDEGAVPLTCLMLDVDFFKQYNDTYGHQKGDECLIKIAEIMKKCFPMRHAKIIRYGGEEFVIFIFNCNKEQGYTYAEKLRSRVEKNHFERKDVPLGYITVSVGVYTEVPNDTDRSEMRDFIHNADSALYIAKNKGRNCVKVYEVNNKI